MATAIQQANSSKKRKQEEQQEIASLISEYLGESEKKYISNKDGNISDDDSNELQFNFNLDNSQSGFGQRKRQSGFLQQTDSFLLMDDVDLHDIHDMEEKEQISLSLFKVQSHLVFLG